MKKSFSTKYGNAYNSSIEDIGLKSSILEITVELTIYKRNGKNILGFGRDGLKELSNGYNLGKFLNEPNY